MISCFSRMNDTFYQTSANIGIFSELEGSIKRMDMLSPKGS